MSQATPLSSALLVLVLGLLVAPITLMHASSDGLARLPPMGWDSWNYIGVSGCEDGCRAEGMDGRCHSEIVMRQMADAMVAKNLVKSGYDLLTVSEGWPAECFRNHTCSGRFANGTIMHDPERYPSGMKAIGDYIHSKGLRFGIYLDAGSVTCAGFPGSLGHEAADVAMVASWGADYVWLDGCNLNASLMQDKYELWSGLFRRAGRDIVWEVSWPAYTYNHSDPGSSAFNTDLWYRSAAVGHEFRFYNDNRPEWAHILDIAVTTTEFNMQRFHRPGAYAFMDMLESGNGNLTPAESRTHFALWAVMAQPLHLGNDLRSMPAALQQAVTNPEVLAVAQDPSCIMGTIVNKTQPGRLTGLQVWARPLADGSRAIVLLNAGNQTADCQWEAAPGGYFESSPATPAGNYRCEVQPDLEALKSECCAAGLDNCVSIAYGDTDVSCLKRNDNGGWIAKAGYVGYKITTEHIDPPSPATICISWEAVGLNPFQDASVRDLWLQRDLGRFADHFCTTVPFHDTAFIRVQQ